MPRINLQGFGGEIPRQEPFYLPETAAASVMNASLRNGALVPFRQATAEEYLFGAACQSIYLHGVEWLGWNHDADVVPGPVSTDRLYISHANGQPTMRVNGAEVPLRLPRPTTRPTIARSGTLDNDLSETVVYAYTWVTSLGEESGPSPLSNSVLWSPGCNIELTALPISAPVANRYVSGKRIYRAVTSASGVTDLFFVAEVGVGDQGFNHNLNTHPIAEAIATKEFDPPPANLRGFTAMPNGIIAAFRGKEICFCEPYQPHAWPGVYALTVTDTIIGLAAFGTTLAVLTTGQPYIVQGMHPESMAMQKMEQPFPCMSKRGIVDMGYSAIYPSTDGLVMVSETGAQLISEELWTYEQWQALQPTTINAARFGHLYGFTYTPMGGEARHIVLVDPRGKQPGVARSNEQPVALYTHVESGRTYFLASNQRTVRAFDHPSQLHKSYTWRSKPFRFHAPTGFAGIRVETDGTEGQTMTARVYADGSLLHTITAQNADARLPAGNYSIWQIEITGTARITRVALADSFRGLGNE